ncbi:MAG: UDP-glucose 4-epimerase GalE [Candidatus Woesearchaeota archaeon]
MKTVLVAGGCGYIGSVAVEKLIQKNYKVIVVDNLSNGYKKLLNKKATPYFIDLNNKKELNKVFKKHNIDSVMHFASYKSVGESMKSTEKYSENIKGSINLLDMMVKYNVNELIFSSSAAVYGNPKEDKVDEETTTNPINYYGFTKLKIEEIIKWYSKINKIDYITFRYFNVCGDMLGYVEESPENIFPIIMDVIKGKRNKLVIFGDDYNTKDGTCIRDYIDVRDLVDAHILALEKGVKNETINLGSSSGYSVKELVDEFSKLSDNLNYKFGNRRKGDPAKLISSNKKAKELLDWESKKSLKEMIKSTYDAYNSN